MKKLRYFILLLVPVLCSLCSSPDTKQQPSLPELEKKIDKIVENFVDSAKIAGLAMGVAKNDSIQFLKSYGFADLAFEVKLPISASFEIGSVTKQFTAVAILQLAENGKLSLTDDITQYINFDTQGKKITVGQLLNHTSGIKGYTEMPVFFESIAMFDYPRDTLLRLVEKEPFDFEPGTAMIYNNTGFFMLGLIIEKVSGKSYPEYLEENIFSKAGMSNTYYCDERKVISNKAYGYDTGGDGKLMKAGYLDHQWPYAAGSLCSTVEDLLKWNHVLHETNLVLSQEMYKELITPSELKNGSQLRYAKGLSVDQYKGVNVISHGGGINGFLSDCRYFPEQKLAIVTLVNSTGPVGPGMVSNVAADLLLPIQEPRYDATFNGDLSAFAGTYIGSSRGSEMETKLETKDNLLFVVNNEKKDTLIFTGNNRWTLNNNFYTFTEENGKITKLNFDVGYGYYVLNKTN